MNAFKLVLLPFLCVSISASSPVSAQTPRTAKPAPAAAPAKMSNSDVIAFASAGLDDSIIIAKIHAAPGTSFDTSIDGLKGLKAAGVSAAVIRVMIDPSASVAASPVVSAAPAAPAAPPAANPDDPATPHSPGVYIYAVAKDGQTHLTKLDHITSKQTKTSGAFLSGMTYGIAKAHVKASIDGATANVQTTTEDPVFYAYIPEDNTTFGGNSFTIRDFSLIRFDPKPSTREVNTASISPWGSSVGTDEKAKQGFTTETIKPGVYKLVLIQPLKPGQYAFQHQNYGAFFDFGVIPPQ